MVTNSNLTLDEKKLMKSFFTLEDALNTAEDLPVSAMEHLSVQDLLGLVIRVVSLARFVRVNEVVTRGPRFNREVRAAKDEKNEFGGHDLNKRYDPQGVFGGLITHTPQRIQYPVSQAEKEFWDKVLESFGQIRTAILGRQNVGKIVDNIFRDCYAEESLDLVEQSASRKKHFYNLKKKS
jgi:hypothetical protein